MDLTKLAPACLLSSLFVACGSPSGGTWTPGGGDASTAASGSGSQSGPDNGGGAGNSGGSGTVTDGGSGGAGGGDASQSGGGGGGAGDDSGVLAPPGDFGAAATCTSNQQWLLGDTKSPEMHPGVACDTCHKVLGSATTYPFDIAGTVYPTAHEPDDCYGVTGATVVITDANNQEHTLAVNAAGNFYNLNYVLVGAIATPYTAKVVYNGVERPMLTPQTSGDCNSCHTQQGTQSAQGRILLP